MKFWMYKSFGHPESMQSFIKVIKAARSKSTYFYIFLPQVLNFIQFKGIKCSLSLRLLKLPTVSGAFLQVKQGRERKNVLYRPIVKDSCVVEQYRKEEKWIKIFAVCKTFVFMFKFAVFTSFSWGDRYQNTHVKMKEKKTGRRASRHRLLCTFYRCAEFINTFSIFGGFEPDAKVSVFNPLSRFKSMRSHKLYITYI